MMANEANRPPDYWQDVENIPIGADVIYTGAKGERGIGIAARDPQKKTLTDTRGRVIAFGDRPDEPAPVEAEG
jgi:ABC-type phosphate/phosphonate transport system substrate-binding protein